MIQPGGGRGGGRPYLTYLLGIEIVDPVAFRVKTVTFRPFSRRGVLFIEELAILWRLFSIFLRYFYE